MAGITWNDLETMLLVALAQAPPPYNVIPPNFSELMPQATQYAEERIRQDLVLLATRVIDTSLSTVSGQRTINLAPTGIIVPEGVALIDPGSTIMNGVRWIFDETSLDMIDVIWPQQSETMSPDAATWIGRWWCMVDNNNLVIAPTPDATYPVIVTGLISPVPLSPTNQTNYISTLYPSLLEAACMVWLSGALLRNFGQQSADPQIAMSWETNYQELKEGAKYEEARRRGLAPDVSAPSPRAA